MKNENTIISTLKSIESTNRSDAKLYDTMVIQRQINSSTPQRIQSMLEFKDGIIKVADHASFKRTSDKCLQCANVLSCKDKC